MSNKELAALLSRLRAWKDATLHRLRERSWRAWLAAVAAGYVILEVLRAFVTDAGTLLLVWMYQGLRWIAQQPMGVGGLAVVVYVTVLITVTWLQIRPRPEPQVRPEAPAPISEDERRLIQDIRTVWGRHGSLAIPQLHSILQAALYELQQQVFWGDLLRPIVQQLDERKDAFVAAINNHQSARIAEVRTAFNDMYAAYIQAMKWVAVLQGKGYLGEGVIADQRLDVWRQNHRDMVNRLHDIVQDPAHAGTLTIFLSWVEEPEFRTFLREAETSPDWLALMCESRPKQKLPLDAVAKSGE
jgi:hypothetical protein